MVPRRKKLTIFVVMKANLFEGALVDPWSTGYEWASMGPNRNRLADAGSRKGKMKEEGR